MLSIKSFSSLVLLSVILIVQQLQTCNGVHWDVGDRVQVLNTMDENAMKYGTIISATDFNYGFGPSQLLRIRMDNGNTVDQPAGMVTSIPQQNAQIQQIQQQEEEEEENSSSNDDDDDMQISIMDLLLLRLALQSQRETQQQRTVPGMQSRPDYWEYTIDKGDAYKLYLNMTDEEKLQTLNQTGGGIIMKVAMDILIPLMPDEIMGSKRTFVRQIGQIVYDKGCQRYDGDDSRGVDFLVQVVEDSFSTQARPTHKSRCLERVFDGIGSFMA